MYDVYWNHSQRRKEMYGFKSLLSTYLPWVRHKFSRHTSKLLPKHPTQVKALRTPVYPLWVVREELERFVVFLYILQLLQISLTNLLLLLKPITTTNLQSLYKIKRRNRMTYPVTNALFDCGLHLVPPTGFRDSCRFPGKAYTPYYKSVDLERMPQCHLNHGSISNSGISVNE